MKKLSDIFRADSGYKVFFLSMITFGLAYGLYKGVIDNYLAEVVSMSSFDKGVSEFFREMPGLLLVFLLAALYMFSAEKIYRIGALFMTAGMAMQAVVPATRVMVILAIFVYSLGDHIQLGMRNTMSLQYAKEGRGGEALGMQSAVHQIGMLAGYLAIVALFFFVDNSSRMFRPVFAVSACIIALGFGATLKMRGDSATDDAKRRFYFRRKYAKYYMLEVFYGARKQIFFTFGPYVLVLFYGANAMVISILFAVSSVCTFFAAPAVGRIIDRFGYKIVMIMDTLILVVVCFFYGFAHHIFPMHVAFVVCCVNYILDSVISLASMASNVYVQDLSDSADEVRATISTGVSVNHLITILIALFGGWIWQALGIETLFVLSAALGLCNSAYAATIRVNRRPKPQTQG
uniref:Major facilitator family transporter n=1 Tax=uncultured bacterium Contig99 TaxID=1393639 RepID=W0FI47_9BACT|nr:major facilitator family transporter [uncultured bacterium Contig99]